MLPIGDTTMTAAELALEGLAMRADLRAQNIANANTPGFLARNVAFEQALGDALTATGSGGLTQVQSVSDLAAPSVVNQSNLPNAQGNTVSVEGEMAGMMKDNLTRDAMVNAFNYKVGLLRTAIGG